MNILVELLNEPLVLLFVILFLGSFLGQIKIRGLSLGASGVLLVAMVFGHFGYQISPVVQNLGLSLFIVAVGLQAGPRFFRMMKTSGLIFGIIGLIVVLIAVFTTIIVSKLFGLSPALSIGLMTGALTSTPGLAAAIQATNDPLASVGYGIAYPFGVLAVVFFVQLLPKFIKLDLKTEMNRKRGPVRHKESPEAMTIEVTNTEMNKKTLKELHLSSDSSVVISRVIRGSRNIISLSDTVILLGDKLVAVGIPRDLEELVKLVGRQVETDVENKDNVNLRKITVDSEEMIGKSIAELRLRTNYGVTVTRMERGGFEFNQKPSWRLERGDVLTVVSSEDRLNDVDRLFARKQLTVTNVHIFSLSLILLVGIFVGMIPIHLPGLGVMTLGVAGGPLFVALIIGHFGKLGPIRARFLQPSNQVIRDIGLVLFLAGAGTTAGEGLVDVVMTEGIRLVFGGSLITFFPIVGGFLVAKKLFHLSILHSLGALCGGMTSTPGLGAVNQLTDEDEPAIAYAAAYPFALIFVAIAAQLLVFVL
ncbi:YidE/YbjL duplication [Salipaludibacillus agaradhaerens]|uniref:YidE/YbjL duplication n=1 Tax=Salipaludibacillus agaradhaerens TaxID=76935 RepID=A0A9Q4FZH4_SALAG|nr:TrkA C-terminal domain-containing protein [Salipaludibacillus agaradhaerens]MCR6097426.1 YidE/YbjL duplication [Salipaludibacillus agaradhaerens]MCR6113090.1 YidE/YbjL duplication [Salipaludibacillus agaradhaerens]